MVFLIYYMFFLCTGIATASEFHDCIENILIRCSGTNRWTECRHHRKQSYCSCSFEQRRIVFRTRLCVYVTFYEMVQCLCTTMSGAALYKHHHEQQSAIISRHQTISILTFQSISTAKNLSNLTSRFTLTPSSTTTYNQRRQCVNLPSPTGAAGAATKPNSRAPTPVRV